MSLSMLGAPKVAFAADAEQPKAPAAADLRVAADRFDEGRADFKALAFDEAAEHFEAADTRAPSSSALMLAMRSRAEAGHFAKAASLAELVLVRDANNPELIAQAERILAAHRAELGRLDIDCVTRCELVIDQKLVHGQAMAVWHVYLDPGPHQVVASFDGARDVVAQTELLPGQTTTLSLVSSPLPPVQSLGQPKPATLFIPPSIVSPPHIPIAQKNNRRLSPTVFWIGVGATAVLGGITTFSWLDAKYNPGRATVEKACAGQGSDCPEYQEGRAKDVRTYLLLGGTVLLGVTTAVTGMFATDFRSNSTDPQRGAPNWSVRPLAGIGPSHSALLGAEGRF